MMTPFFCLLVNGRALLACLVVVEMAQQPNDDGDDEEEEGAEASEGRGKWGVKPLLPYQQKQKK